MGIQTCQTWQSSEVVKRSEKGLSQLSEAERKTEEDVTWMWEAGREAEMANVGMKHGNSMIAATVTLNSAQPLQNKDIHDAATHLLRKSPNLRACLRRRDGKLWFCQHQEASIDFKILNKDADTAEEVNKLGEQGFSSSDSLLWKMRLIPRGQNAQCIIPDVKANFPHQYDLIMFVHHIIADGMNSVMIIQCFLDLLNDIISGVPIDDSEQFGCFSKGTDIRTIEAMVADKLTKDSNRLEKVKNYLPSPNKSLVLLEAFPPENEAKTITSHVTRIINPKIIQSFRDCCKENNVTFNSAFVAAINTAIMELLSEAGTAQEEVLLTSYHLVDLRRYLKPTPEPRLGCIRTGLSYSVSVNKKVRQNFWDHSILVNQELQTKLKSGEVFEHKVVREMGQSEMSPEEYYQNPPPPIHDFSVTNMGDLSRVTPGIGQHVQITGIMPMCLINEYRMMSLHQIFTFRGHSSYSISFPTQYMSDETAAKLVDKVIAVMENVSS